MQGKPPKLIRHYMQKAWGAEHSRVTEVPGKISSKFRSLKDRQRAD
jgi:hypothetical protein